MAILKPKLIDAKVESQGKVIIATVKGDLHDIGKNLVSMMLEGAGYEILDMGTDASAESIVEAQREQKADIIALSALLTTTTPCMQDTINALADAGLRDSVKVIVGGAPLTDDFADGIGADGFAPDASKAVSLVKSLMP